MIILTQVLSSYFQLFRVLIHNIVIVVLIVSQGGIMKWDKLHYKKMQSYVIYFQYMLEFSDDLSTKENWII